MMAPKQKIPQWWHQKQLKKVPQWSHQKPFKKVPQWSHQKRFHNHGTKKDSTIIAPKQIKTLYTLITRFNIFVYLSTILTMFILNIIVLLFILNFSTRFLNFLFSLSFLKTLPCWYAKLYYVLFICFNEIFIFFYNVHSFLIVFYDLLWWVFLMIVWLRRDVSSTIKKIKH